MSFQILQWIPQKAQRIVTTRHSKSTPRHRPERTENRDLYRHMDVDDHGGITHNGQKEGNRPSVHRQMNGQTGAVQPRGECYRATTRDEVLVQTTAWMSLGNITPSETNQTQKHKYCLIPPVSNVRKGQIHGQKVDRRPPRAGGLLPHGHRGSVWGDEMFWKWRVVMVA